MTFGRWPECTVTAARERVGELRRDEVNSCPDLILWQLSLEDLPVHPGARFSPAVQCYL